MLKDKTLINPEVRIENTDRCNASCIMCAHSQMTRTKGTMTTAFFRDLVKQAKDLGATTISVFGFGEPFLDSNLVGKIKICDELGLDTFITTNASLCTWTVMYDLFAAGLTHLRFSVHGVNGNYEKTQFGLKYDTLMTNIFSTILLRDKIYPERKISVTAMPISGETIEDLKIWEHTGIDWLEIWRPHNWATKKQFRTKSSIRRSGCFRPVKGPLQIQWDGKVIPCCFLTNAELVLGDTHKQTLEEILKGDPYEELRARHRKGDLDGLPCYDCDQLNIEEESPLLYSNRDEEMKINTTSSLKFSLEE